MSRSLNHITGQLRASGTGERCKRRLLRDEVGYPHLADPSKLLKSAARIYGEENMGELFGEAKAVPEDRLVKLEGGEEIEAAGGLLSAHYTPGHAYHHLAYLEPESGHLFAGDVAGVRLPGQSYVKPPTPPT